VRKQPLTFVQKLGLIVAVGATTALLTASNTLGALVGGALPTSGFTFTSVTDNEVNMAGSAIHLKTKDPVNVKSTYSRVAPDPAFRAGWHYHDGPVIVTVTVGTLTFFDSACGTWDLTAGHTYIETAGEVLNAKVLPDKNPGIATVEWLSTRLYPAEAVDPVPIDPPCAL
jgi:hypothetical protein